MENCKKCKHWNAKPIKNLKDYAPASGVFGTCTKLASSTSDAHQLIPFGAPTDMVLIVGQNFGCVQFSPNLDLN